MSCSFLSDSLEEKKRFSSARRIGASLEITTYPAVAQSRERLCEKRERPLNTSFRQSNPKAKEMRMQDGGSKQPEEETRRHAAMPLRGW